MLAIGYQITFLRKQKGLTQAGLARRSGIPQPNLSRIERGEQDPTLSTFFKICSSLNVHPAEIFKRSPKKKHILWTRSALERVAHSVVGSSENLGEGEREIVELLKDIIPGFRRRLSSRRVYQSWSELRQRLSREEIRALLERVHDARQRAS